MALHFQLSAVAWVLLPFPKRKATSCHQSAVFGSSCCFRLSDSSHQKPRGLQNKRANAYTVIDGRSYELSQQALRSHYNACSAYKCKWTGCASHFEDHSLFWSTTYFMDGT